MAEQHRKKTEALSGLSIALGFVALGVLFGYWLKDTYASATRYVAAGLILFGVVFFLIEMQKRITNHNVRIENAGVGLLLLVPGVYGAYMINVHTSGWGRGVLGSLVAIVVLIGFMAFIDLIVSIFEQLVKSDNIKLQIIGFLKFVTLLLTSAAGVFAALQQFLDH